MCNARKHLVLLLGGDGFDPISPVCLDELLGARSAAEVQPYRAALGRYPQTDVKERTASSLSINPFSRLLIGLRVRGKLDLVAVGQFAHGRSLGHQRRPEHIEMSLALRGSQGALIAVEGTLLGGGCRRMSTGLRQRVTADREKGHYNESCCEAVHQRAP